MKTKGSKPQQRRKGKTVGTLPFKTSARSSTYQTQCTIPAEKSTPTRISRPLRWASASLGFVSNTIFLKHSRSKTTPVWSRIHPHCTPGAIHTTGDLGQVADVALSPRARTWAPLSTLLNRTDVFPSQRARAWVLPCIHLTESTNRHQVTK